MGDRRWRKFVEPDLPEPAELAPYFESIFENGWFSNFGPLAREFEAALVRDFGGGEEACVSAASATAGLSAALLAGDVRGAVLLPAFTFPASYGAVKAAGCEPIVVDVEARDWTLSLDILGPALDATHARAVMLVAPFGMRRDFAASIEHCRARGVTVVIDNAAGLGAPARAPIVREGVFEVFSLHATKPFAVGEGGAVFAHRCHEEALRRALNFGLPLADNAGAAWGFNGKMSEFHAAIGLAQTQRWIRLRAARRDFVGAYLERLADLNGVLAPHELDAAPWQFLPALMPSATAAGRAVEAAARLGLEVRRYYRPSLSRWPGARTWAPCLVAEELSERICALPVRSSGNVEERAEIISIAVAALSEAL